MIPFPRPTTREEARSNAIYFAGEVAHRTTEHADASVTISAEAQARLWAAIAQTFPEDPTLLADDQSESRPTHLDVTGRTFTQVSVDAEVWQIVRSLAVRYVRTSITSAITLSSEEWTQDQNELALTWGDGDSVTATLDPGPMVR